MGTFGGEVTNHKMFTKKFVYTPDGLFSESIFGPERDYCCACGKLSSKSLDVGKLCDKCGVMCISKDARLTTFGKITLTLPIFKPTKKKFLKKITGNQHKYLLDSRRADATVVTARYLAISPDGTKLWITNSPKDSQNYILPLRITGIYSFILALKYVAEYLKLDVAKELFDKEYITNVIKVLPPEIRPVIRDPKKQDAIRVTKITKIYTSLLILNKIHTNIKMVKEDYETEWLKIINVNFKKSVVEGVFEEIVDQMIQEYDRISAKYQSYVDNLYSEVFDLICGKYGFIRSSILGKTIEFSGRSVITINPSLPPYKIKVSKKILYKLWFPYFLHFLQKKHPEFNFIELFDKFVQSTDYKDNKELFNEFLADFTKEPETEKIVASTIVKMKKIERDDE